MLGNGDTGDGSEILRSHWETMVQPRDWQPQAAAATPWLEKQREDEVVPGLMGQGFWKDSGTTQWDLEPWTQRTHYQCCVTTA